MDNGYTILEQIKLRLKQFHVEENGAVVFTNKEDDPLLEQLIKQVTNEVMNRRMYPETYTQEQIYEDLKKFELVIVNVVVYDRSQAGESFMQSYSENGVSRTWIDRDKLFKDVYPFVKIL